MSKSMRQMILTAAVVGVTGLVFLPAQQVIAQQPAPLAAQNTAAPSTQPVADIPIKQVVLFSSGVGYFEHFGTVTGDSSTELPFKVSQINDILKSLVLEDLDGGKISAVTYPSQDPLAKTLKSFQVDITANPPLADLLNQLRGAKITAHLQDNDSAQGIVLGVEFRTVPAPAGQTPVAVPFLNILTGATIRQVELSRLNDVTFADPTLQDELDKALVALAQSRDQDKKPVTINFRGEGTRGVRIGYVVSTPIWKTSYRLLLNADPKEKPSLQGWAIVENQTDNDWNNVQLSLVSGRPISFVEDLYQPLYVPRPVVEPELFASLRPPVDYGAINQNGPVEAAAPQTDDELNARAAGGALMQNVQRPSMAKDAHVAFAVNGGSQWQNGLGRPINPGSSVASIASAEHIGELFEYTVGNVSLPRQKSAMLPIITDPVQVERLSIYNENVLAHNPLNGARVTNTTGKHLLAGPVTVFDGGSYAGDAQIDNLPPGQNRLLSYGVDLEMKVQADAHNSDDTPILTGKIDKGVLVVTRKFTSSKDYTADNKSEKDKMLIVEHPRRGGWDLVDTAKPDEKTDDCYRFKFPVAAGKVVKLTVNEESTQDQQIAILPCDVDQLAFYYEKAGAIPKSVHDAIGKALDMKRAVVDSDRQINEHDQQLNQITVEQNRIRENMRTVGKGNAYYDRLLKKLDEQEDSVEKLQQERTDLTQKREQQQKDLENYLADLTV